jgi:uncharacterized membrane protein YeaQ/YmgE (transglycosylase-associated protein family)
MGLFSWIIIGISVGWITNFFFKRRSKTVRACRVFAGMSGALTGGILANVITFGDPINLNFAWQSLAVAFISAILLVIFSFFETRQKGYSY